MLIPGLKRMVKISKCWWYKYLFIESLGTVVFLVVLLTIYQEVGLLEFSLPS
jgi:hypothetical protein